VIAAVLLFVAATNCAPTAGCPADIRTRIRTQGDFSRLFHDDNAWDEVLQRIATGELSWLELAKLPDAVFGRTSVGRDQRCAGRRNRAAPNGNAEANRLRIARSQRNHHLRQHRKSRYAQGVSGSACPARKGGAFRAPEGSTKDACACLREIRNARAAVRKYFRS